MFSGSILCSLGTKYVIRGSIVCSEHTVALQILYYFVNIFRMKVCICDVSVDMKRTLFVTS